MRGQNTTIAAPKLVLNRISVPVRVVSIEKNILRERIDPSRPLPTKQRNRHSNELCAYLAPSGGIARRCPPSLVRRRKEGSGDRNGGVGDPSARRVQSQALKDGR